MSSAQNCFLTNEITYPKLSDHKVVICVAPLKTAFFFKFRI